MSEYQLTPYAGQVIRVSDGAVIPEDEANRDWQDYVEWVKQGNEADSYVPPPPPPRSVTPAQARIALLRAGKLDDVETLVENTGGEIAIWWERALEIRENNPYVVQLAQAMGLDLKQLFDVAEGVDS